MKVGGDRRIISSQGEIILCQVCQRDPDRCKTGGVAAAACMLLPAATVIQPRTILKVINARIELQETVLVI